MNIVPGTNFVISKVTFANTGGFRAENAFAGFWSSEVNHVMLANPENTRVLGPLT